MKFPYERIKSMYSENHVLVVLSLCVLVALIFILRSFNAVFYPILFNEDGTQIVAYFLSNPYPSEIFRFYEGYISLIPNLIGYLSLTYLPLHVVPYVLVFSSLGFAVAAYSFFSLRRFRFIMPDDRARFMICLLLALMPFGNQALFTNLTFSIWNIFTLSLLIILSPPPRSLWAKVAQMVFLALAIFSNPYSVLFVPICITLMFVRHSRTDRMINAGIIGLALLYFFLGIKKSVVGPQMDFAAVLATLECIAHRVVFEPVFGNHLRMILQKADHQLVTSMWSVCILAGLAAVVFNYSRSDRVKGRVPLFAMILFLIVSLTYISISGRLEKYGSFIAHPWAHRYFYTQQILFVFIILMYVVGLVNWKRFANGTRISLLVLVVCYLSYLNVHHVSFFTTSKERGLGTLRFLRDADEQLEKMRRGEAPPRKIVLHRTRWDIKIVPPGAEDPEE